MTAVQTIPSTIPRPATALVGRGHELALVESLLARPGIRLITLTGPGGTGKTRLAIEVALAAQRLFSSWVVFVPLASLSDPELLFPTIAQALGLPRNTN